MERIAVFGKGGVGKSTFAAHLSAWFAGQGRRVLHVGCDPKADSSLLLLDGAVPARTVVEILSENPTADPREAINRGRLGIDCIEAGGPEPGIGCGGRGITWAIDFLEKGGLLARTYDVVLFDVLGDVVCGGFAAPLRRGLADLVVIVASPDEMSFFAANNIARAVVRYADNGVALAGLVLNERSAAGQDLDGHAFARTIGAQVLGQLPFSPALADARRHRRTLNETAARDPFAVAVASIGNALASLDRTSLALPCPLSNQAFHQFVGGASLRSAGGFSPPPHPQAPKPITPQATAPTQGKDQGSSGASLRSAGGFSPAPLPPTPSRLAGPSTLSRLGHVLGFDLPELRGARASVAAAVLTSTGEVGLTVRYGKLPPQRLIVLPPGREGAYIALPNLGIAYHGSDPSVALHKLASWVAGRLRDIGFSTLASWVARPPDSSDVAAGGDPGDEAPHRTGQGRVWSLRAGRSALEALEARILRDQPRRRTLDVSGQPGAHGPAGSFEGTADESQSLTLVRADSRTDGILELDVRLADQSVRTLLLVPLGSPSFLDVATCGIGHVDEGDARTLALVRRLAGAVDAIPLDSLHEVVRSDPESTPVGRPGGPEHDDASFRQTPQWRQFFADDHFARNVHQLLQYEAPHVAVEHCDRECMYPTPPALEHQPDVYEYPWLEPEPFHGGPLARSGAGGITLTTDLTDRDVVRGAIVRLEDALQRACGALEEEQFVLVHNTCTPVVAGEDVSGLVHRVGLSCPVPLMHTAPHIDGNPLADFFARRKKERGFTPHAPHPGLVNLVGFPTNRGTDELCRLLARAGIRVNDRAFPRVDLRLFDTYLKASLQVFYPEHYLARLRDALFSDLPLVTLEPEAPFGFERTRAWLTAVIDAGTAPSAAAGTPGPQGEVATDCCNATSDGIAEGYGGKHSVILEEWGARLPEWDRHRSEAATCTLGFVVDSWRVERLADPSVNFALPLLALLAEMGFRIELLLYGKGGTVPSALEEAARGLAPGADITLRGFGTEDELTEALALSQAQAFYSDFTQDQRLARAGKARFSSRVFEMGFAGAVRTLERLVSVCRLPFFRRYGRVGWP
ncbi:MAG: hypothetical protein FJ109_05810 [Deltaproteobacteria bacterium]|nr:hypothetical protein [Deltaproteobacteria bacterium]